MRVLYVSVSLFPEMRRKEASNDGVDGDVVFDRTNKNDAQGGKPCIADDVVSQKIHSRENFVRVAFFVSFRPEYAWPTLTYKYAPG
jgi:hypothetical protein